MKEGLKTNYNLDTLLNSEKLMESACFIRLTDEVKMIANDYASNAINLERAKEQIENSKNKFKNKMKELGVEYYE